MDWTAQPATRYPRTIAPDDGTEKFPSPAVLSKRVIRKLCGRRETQGGLRCEDGAPSRSAVRPPRPLLPMLPCSVAMPAACSRPLLPDWRPPRRDEAAGCCFLATWPQSDLMVADVSCVAQGYSFRRALREEREGRGGSTRDLSQGKKPRCQTITDDVVSLPPGTPVFHKGHSADAVVCSLEPHVCLLDALFWGLEDLEWALWVVGVCGGRWCWYWCQYACLELTAERRRESAGNGVEREKSGGRGIGRLWWW